MALGNNAIAVLFIVIVLCATRGATRSVAKQSADAPAAAPEASSAAAPSAAAADGTIFDITKLGATADGKTDSTVALQEAWTLACAAAGQPTIIVPAGDFLVGPLNFTGPCKGDLTLQIDGTLLGSNDLAKYVASWIEIMHVHNIVITGSGTLDGQGAPFWDKGCTADCKILPNTLVLDFVTNGTISGITLRNSKFFHINLYASRDVAVRNVTISAPGDSINTDGIHIGDSSNIAIEDATIGTGDDCISIGGGSRRVSVSGVTCGPGQGISIGCVGRYKDEKDVSEVTVRDCVLRNSTNGVRIKTYEEAVSSITVSRVMFENIKMDEVANPIIIDQKYCPDKVCSVKGASAVTVKDVTFRNITGTSSTPEAVSLLCLDKQPCSGVELIDVNVEYTGKNKTIAVCSNAIGIAKDSPEARACLM